MSKNKKTQKYQKQTKVDKIKKQQSQIEENEKLEKLRKKIDEEVDYTMDGSVKQLFLNLTKMQIPFDYEKTLEGFLPDGIQKDQHENYYIKIGDTKTMFCCHLDTYCYEYKRVWHVIKDNMVYTDGTTTLGGDDKAGATIMIKMIEAGVPGLYYFFRGEEGVTSPSGTWGSKQAIKTYKSNFEKYERCIAFDRRDTNNLITQQMYAECCSDEFADQLIKELGEYNLRYYNDPSGMWCDSGVFMELIPECTNISVGYKNEHTFNEVQDLEHLEKLTEACININWESLPTKRDPSDVSYGVGNYNYDYEWDSSYSSNIKRRKYSYDDKREYVTMHDMFDHVVELLYDIDYDALNPTSFDETEEMYFQNYQTGDFFGLKIIDFDIYISEDDTLKMYEYIGDLDTFENYITVGQNPKDNVLIKDDQDDEIETPFTIEQNNEFIKLINIDPDIVAEAIKDIKSKNKMEVSTDTWLDLEKSMYKSGIEVNYEDQGLNPDDFVDWLGYNWDKVLKLLDFDNKYATENTISERDAIYYDISLNKERNSIEQFIEQVINKDFLIKKENYKKYKDSIERWFNKDYKNELNIGTVDYISFINWLKEHKKDLLEYYK